MPMRNRVDQLRFQAEWLQARRDAVVAAAQGDRTCGICEQSYPAAVFVRLTRAEVERVARLGKRAFALVLSGIQAQEQTCANCRILTEEREDHAATPGFATGP